MAKKLIKNAYAIVTCDANDNVFYESDLLIDGPAIVKIGKNIEAEDAEVIDASDKIIYPGLINTHHHFFQTFVRNLMTIDYPNLMVMDWIDKIYRIFKEIDLSVSAEVVICKLNPPIGGDVESVCVRIFDKRF